MQTMRTPALLRSWRFRTRRHRKGHGYSACLVTSSSSTRRRSRRRAMQTKKIRLRDAPRHIIAGSGCHHVRVRTRQVERGPPVDTAFLVA